MWKRKSERCFYDASSRGGQEPEGVGKTILRVVAWMAAILSLPHLLLVYFSFSYFGMDFPPVIEARALLRNGVGVLSGWHVPDGRTISSEVKGGER